VLENSQNGSNKDEVELFGKGGGSGGVTTWNKDTSESLQHSTRLLEDSRRMIAETEDVRVCLLHLYIREREREMCV
jgi:hypothetical protein